MRQLNNCISTILNQIVFPIIFKKPFYFIVITISGIISGAVMMNLIKINDTSIGLICFILYMIAIYNITNLISAPAILIIDLVSLTGLIFMNEGKDVLLINILVLTTLYLTLIIAYIRNDIILVRPLKHILSKGVFNLDNIKKYLTDRDLLDDISNINKELINTDEDVSRGRLISLILVTYHINLSVISRYPEYIKYFNKDFLDKGLILSLKFR